MSKFKVGDRVRALVDYCDLKKGNEYTIDDTCGGGFIIDGDLMFDYELEAASPQPATKIQLQIGKTYRSRCGDKWTVTDTAAPDEYSSGYQFVASSANDRGTAFRADGCYRDNGDETSDDLVAEWPAETNTTTEASIKASCVKASGVIRTRREIVDGNVEFDDGAKIQITVHGDSVEIDSGYFFSPKALREAAAMFLEMADVLEETA